MKFFRGGRVLTSVLSRYPKILDKIMEKYGPEIAKVRDYYNIKQSEVSILDIAPHIGRSV